MAVFCVQLINEISGVLKWRTCLSFRSKDIIQDLYLAPYACAEVGFLQLEEGDLDQAKEYLHRARYNWKKHA